MLGRYGSRRVNRAETITWHPRAPPTDDGLFTRVSMRACARVALASIAVSASFSLSGCATIEELKETFLRWIESEKLPSGRGVSADELPEATPVVPPEKTSKRQPRPKDAARKLQRQTVMLPPKKPPIPDSTEAVRPEGTEGQSAPSQPTPRWLRSRWPEAPPPERFSR
jgi:hypothetical protein